MLVPRVWPGRGRLDLDPGCGRRAVAVVIVGPSRRASHLGRGAKAILVARVRVLAPRVPPPPRHLLVQQLDVQSHGLERVHLAQVGPRLVLGALLGAHLPPAAAGGARPVASLRVERVQQELGLIAERVPIRAHLRGPDGGVELVGVGHRRHDSRVTPRAPRAARPDTTDHSKVREDLFNLVRVSRREWR